MFRLELQVHLDAMAAHPVAYLKAVLWRLRGFKVRSRGRMAALIARSPHAYELWIAREEQRTRDLVRVTGDTGNNIIVPLIDCRSGSAGLDQTIASLDPDDARRAIILSAESGANPSAGTAPETLQADRLWVCPIRSGDLLAQDALSIYSGALAASPEAELFYADDDLVDRSGRRHDPHLKPNWNPDLFKHHDFLTGASIVRVRVEALRSIGAEKSLRVLVDEALSSGAPPRHVPVILHHRAQRPKPCVPNKPLATTMTPTPSLGVIIPTRNKVSLLSKCVEGLRRTDYPSLEIIVIDNGSDEATTLDYLASLESQGVTVLRLPGPFNYSALNNSAVQHCRGDFLCFLNNDIEMIEADWLSLLVRQAVREEIGAVGARLLYPDGTVQHAGVVTGVGGGAAHAHRLQPKDAEGYFERARLPQRVSAVTAACLVVERRKFLSVGGFDERKFPVAFNDVDLCLKLNDSGWQSFYEPRATLIHHESKSRGRDTTKVTKARFAGELAALKEKWGTDDRVDPYHHPHLSRYTEQFLLAV